MPYIHRDQRYFVDTTPAAPDGHDPIDAGQLNYVLTRICVRYFHQRGGRYQQINDVLGAIEGAKAEFYRRLAAPYEDEKCAENGDVYPAITRR